MPHHEWRWILVSRSFHGSNFVEFAILGGSETIIVFFGWSSLQHLVVSFCYISDVLSIDVEFYLQYLPMLIAMEEPQYALITNPVKTLFKWMAVALMASTRNRWWFNNNNRHARKRGPAAMATSGHHLKLNECDQLFDLNHSPFSLGKCENRAISLVLNVTMTQPPPLWQILDLTTQSGMLWFFMRSSCLDWFIIEFLQVKTWMPLRDSGNLLR